MEHYAHADARADVRGARGEVAQLVAERVGDVFFDGVVEFVDGRPAFVEGQAAAEDLDAEVVLLVNHQADVLFISDADPTGAVRLGMFAADQLPLDEKLPVESLEAGDVDVAELGADPKLIEVRAQ